jgi:hypothetical protein
MTVMRRFLALPVLAVAVSCAAAGCGAGEPYDARWRPAEERADRDATVLRS